MIRLLDNYTGEVVEVSSPRGIKHLFRWVATMTYHNGQHNNHFKTGSWARRLQVEATDPRTRVWVREELRRKFPTSVDQYQYKRVVMKRFKCSECTRLIHDKVEYILCPKDTPLDEVFWNEGTFGGICDTCILHLHDSILAPVDENWWEDICPGDHLNRRRR